MLYEWYVPAWPFCCGHCEQHFSRNYQNDVQTAQVECSSLLVTKTCPRSSKLAFPQGCECKGPAHGTKDRPVGSYIKQNPASWSISLQQESPESQLDPVERPGGVVQGLVPQLISLILTVHGLSLPASFSSCSLSRGPCLGWSTVPAH